jgi:SnoaL-like domain
MQSEEFSRADVANMMQGLLDRQAIQDVISCYSLGQDSHQGEDSAILQQWEETFSETGTVDYSVAGGTVGSYRDLAKWMRGDENTKGSMSGFSNWQHMLSLPLVSIAMCVFAACLRRIHDPGFSGVDSFLVRSCIAMISR